MFGPTVVWVWLLIRDRVTGWGEAGLNSNAWSNDPNAHGFLHSARCHHAC
jgi:hypothetical protein